ncbi:MAG: hypothetical protein LC658_09285, partial [Bacteroidales bacterium]|nr:hypothetical protein [Bacteroidales bacterium]
MFDFFKIIIIQIFILFVWFGCTPVNKPLPEDDGFELIFHCGAEEVDDESYSFPESSGDSLSFGNVNTRTGEVAFSGNFSLKLTPEKLYGFTTEYTVGPDEYFQVTAWRKCTGDDGAIAIGAGGELYKASKKVVEINSEGWEKIYLEMFSPPHIAENKLTIFVWNVGNDTVYFDDIQIVHRNKKHYPAYDSLKSLSIYAEPEHLSYFDTKRIEAFDKGVLVNEDADFAGAVIFDGNEFLNGEIRLKGDLMDHIQGDKWSFRIKLKKDFAWNNVRTFSIQDPATRNFLHEWMAHQIFDYEDVLTTRYGFVPLILNNQSKGI